MHETKEKMKDICSLKETLCTWAKQEVGKGVEQVNAEELGEVVDMIKDLVEAEEKCIKACYYKKLIEEMDEEAEGERMGYNARRYASGRYAPKGAGVLGYVPIHMNEDWDETDMRMGYTTTNQSGDKRTMSYGYVEGLDPRYGKAYNDYKNARRHYTETHSQADHDKMHAHAKEHLTDSIASIREMWDTSDADLKQRIKTDLSKFVGELTI